MRIAVVALGKIGLPLAVQFAMKGHRVFGADIDVETVRKVNDGIEPFPGEYQLDVALRDVVARAPKPSRLPSLRRSPQQNPRLKKPQQPISNLWAPNGLNRYLPSF